MEVTTWTEAYSEIGIGFSIPSPGILKHAGVKGLR